MTSTWLFFTFKAVLSGILVAAISTVAKAFPKWAALLTALPLITFLSLIWIYIEKRDLKLLETYTLDVMLWTLPSFLFFITAIFLFRSGISFYLTLALAMLSLAVGLVLFQKWGILK